MPDTPLSIFISYSHADSAFVDQLEADLRQQGFETWVDRQRLAGGQRWRRELQEAVEHAQVLLIVLSPDAIASQSVQIEFDYALDLSKLLIPVYFRECEVPMELRAIQWIDFRHSYEQGLAALLDVLHRQQERVVASGSSPQDGARLLEGRPAAPATSEADAARSLVGQQPAAPTKPEPMWKVPSTFTSLIGREQEVAELSALLTQPEMRLLTLVGPGGIGKTRLGIAVATQVRESFTAGICFVGLAAINDPHLVVPTIAQELGLKEIGARPPLEQVQAFVGAQHFLLVLDNFEQVVAAAQEVEQLLTNCPHLTLLVTSRAVLHLPAEQVVPVAPLALPDLAKDFPTESIAQSAAVVLFVQRTRSQLPSFQLTAANARAIAEVCVRLDGLPLAIELAAARVKLLPPQALLARLSQRLQLLTGGPRTLPARQQTLRNTIQWSYDLLGPEEQVLFRRLSVFVGGWTLEAAERLAQQTGYAHLDVLNTLASLLDNSLIQQSEQEADQPRFLMLQTVLEFGLEVLQSTGETQVTREAHAQYFLELAEQAEPHLHDAEQASWFTHLEQEHENLRAALTFLLAQARLTAGTQEGQQQAEHALRLGVALSWFWIIRGYFREGLAFLEQVLTTGESMRASLRAKALYAAAELAFYLDDWERAEQLGKQNLPLFRELGDQVGIADSVFTLGIVAWGRGEYAAARPQFEEAASLYQEIAERWKRGRCLTQLARIDTAQAKYDRAHTLLEESLELYRVLGDKERLGWVLYLLARLLFLSGRDLVQARKLTQQSLALFEEVESSWYRAYSLILLGQLTLEQGEQAQAQELFEEGVAQFKEVGDRGDATLGLLGLARVALLQGDLLSAKARYQESLVYTSEGLKEDLAPALEGLAAVDAQQGELERAARLWGAAQALRKAIGVPLPPIERADYEHAVAGVRAQLGEDSFAARWQEGRTMQLEQVIDDVLKRGDETGKQ